MDRESQPDVLASDCLYAVIKGLTMVLLHVPACPIPVVGSTDSLSSLALSSSQGMSHSISGSDLAGSTQTSTNHGLGRTPSTMRLASHKSSLSAADLLEFDLEETSPKSEAEPTCYEGAVSLSNAVGRTVVRGALWLANRTRVFASFKFKFLGTEVSQRVDLRLRNKKSQESLSISGSVHVPVTEGWNWESGMEREGSVDKKYHSVDESILLDGALRGKKLNDPGSWSLSTSADIPNTPVKGSLQVEHSHKLASTSIEVAGMIHTPGYEESDLGAVFSAGGSIRC